MNRPGFRGASTEPGAVQFWAALVVALAVAFVITVPVNRWLIGRGEGHAVVHQFHAPAASSHDPTGEATHPGHHHEH